MHIGVVLSLLLQTIALPLTVRDGVLYVPARAPSGHAMLFIFDPGAGDFLSTHGKAALGNGSALQFGAATLRETLPVTDDDPRAASVDGSVGPGLLKSYAVRIDYARRTLELIPFEQFKPPGKIAAMPLKMDAYGVPAVMASVDGHPALFEIDVRAPTSMLFQPFADSTGLARQYSASPVLATKPQRVQHRVQAMQVGSNVVRNIPMFFGSYTSGKFAARDLGGLLGNDVLSSFTITLNLQTHRVYFQPVK